MHNNIIILLATHNGESYISAQLNSILEQTNTSWKLLIHDDNSTDNTVDIIKQYQKQYSSKIQFIDDDISFGNASDNFNFLLGYIDTEYIMFCDQDDVWKKDKIDKTLQKMKEVEKEGKQAVLIHTDLVVVDESLQVLNNSFWDYQNLNPKNSNFSHFVIQNNITGCSVMINKKLAKLALPIPKETIMHDWWLGLVASKFGKIAYLNEPTILYRQHLANDTGAKRFDIRFLAQNAKKTYKNRKQMFDKYIIQAKKFLEVYQNQLDEETIKMLKDFSNIKSNSWWNRFMILKKYKLFKQDFWRNIGFLFSV